MLTLWYLVLGWKEYNKPFRKPAEPAQSVDPVKKPDLIPQKKDDKTTDIGKPEPPKSMPITPEPPTVPTRGYDPKPPSVPPRGSDPFFLHNKSQDTPKTPEDIKPTLPSPKIPESPKVPELPKVTTPKTPEPPKVPELPKVSPNLPKTPEPPKVTPPTPKTPETPKVPELPKVSPGTPKTPDMPKMPEPPKTPESPKIAAGFPKTPETPKTPEVPKTPDAMPPNAFPSRRPESVLPDFPPSRNFPSSNLSEFPMPPYLPGAPNSQKPTSRDDELFGMGNNRSNANPNANPNKPFGNLRDLSYARGEIPDEALENGAAFAKKVQENVSKIPKFTEQTIVSEQYSSDSEDEEDF